MSAVDISVTPLSDASRDHLPSEFGRYAIYVGLLLRQGRLGEISEALKLARQRGFQGIDIFLFVLAFFSAQRWNGLHQFANQSARWGEQLAGVGERLKWPSQASVSRAMSAISIDQARIFADFLLRESLDMSPLLQHDSVLHFDGNAEGWHVFDFDPTSTVMRQRALPTGPELPQPHRLSDRLGAPGYTGRKRGDVKLSRPTLQHRGARLWLGVDLEPGNGEWSTDVHKAMNAVAELAELHQLGVDRCIVCTDGEQGGHTQTRLGLASPVHFLTRLAVYELLKTEAAKNNLNQVSWEPVESSGSGPKRWASELGSLGSQEGEARLVVTRFRNENTKRGAGVVIDGWQYEIFATDLSPEAFSAADLVTLYYARCGQESYFALEDRELGLDHIFSYNLGGQLVCVAIGLWMANAEIVLGWQLQESNVERPDPPTARQVERSPGRREWLEPTPVDSTSEPDGWKLDVTSRPGFRWDEQRQVPICPAGQLMRPHGQRPGTYGRIDVRFRAAHHHCKACTKRQQCTTSTSPSFRREVTIQVEPDVADALKRAPQTSNHPASPPAERRWKPPLRRIEPGPWAHRGPVLLPRRLRSEFQQLCMQAHVVITATPLPKPPAVPAIFHPDAAQRHHRRRTWEERIAWNARPASKATVRLSIIAPVPLQHILAPPLRTAPSAAES